MDAREFIFKRYSPENKKKFIEEMSEVEYLWTSYDILERCLKEAGRRISAKHIDKELRLNTNIASNEWNSNIETLYSEKKKLYLTVYIQGYDTDGYACFGLREFLTTGEHSGYFTEYYGDGTAQRIKATYDKHNRANVIKAILLAYVENKYKKNDKQ